MRLSNTTLHSIRAGEFAISLHPNLSVPRGFWSTPYGGRLTRSVKSLLPGGRWFTFIGLLGALQIVDPMSVWAQTQAREVQAAAPGMPAAVTQVQVAAPGMQSAAPGDPTATFTEQALRRHIEILSSDEFEGRAPATRGEELTIDYLVGELARIGVSPGMPDGSYTQFFPLLGSRVDRQSARFTWKAAGDAHGKAQAGGDIHKQAAQGSFRYYDEFMGWPSNEQEQVRVKDAELLYVGYGIQAPEFDWDDYKGVDVKGKVLIYKNSDPAYDEALFAGNTRLYYGRWSYKFEKAFEMGALGAIIVHTTPTAGYPWLVVSNSWGRQRFTLKSRPGQMDNAPAFNGWLTTGAAQTLFEAAGLSLREQLQAADSPDFTPVPLNGVTVDVALDAEYVDKGSRNVIGVIPGSDPELSREALVLTAHHDHLGVTMPVQGDSINNGAHDDAAGVSALLNLAEAFKKADHRRSVILLLVGAEEMGLLGSKYWAENPTIDPSLVTANLNLDAMQVYGPTEDFVMVGYGRNTFSDVMEQVAIEKGRTVVPDPNPEQGFFYRSDHFSLAKVGIPALFPSEGRRFIGKPEGHAAVVDSVKGANYHNVNDEINEYWDLAGLIRDMDIYLEASLRVLNADAMMEWKPGDEFEAVRKASLERRASREAQEAKSSVKPDTGADAPAAEKPKRNRRKGRE